MPATEPNCENKRVLLEPKPSAKPRKQKPPRMPDEKDIVTKVEVQRSLDEGLKNASLTFRRMTRKVPINNASQSNCYIFKGFCNQMTVEVVFALSYHPQPNGTVERAKALIFLAIKRFMEDQLRGKRAEELSRTV
jgi:hypothetical protein